MPNGSRVRVRGDSRCSRRAGRVSLSDRFLGTEVGKGKRGLGDYFLSETALHFLCSSLIAKDVLRFVFRTPCSVPCSTHDLHKRSGQSNGERQCVAAWGCGWRSGGWRGGWC